MTEQKTPEQWEAERKERDMKRCNAFNKLEQDQKDAIRQALSTMAHCLEMLNDCHDLYLSDVSKLNDAYWCLNNNFPTKDA